MGLAVYDLLDCVARSSVLEEISGVGLYLFGLLG